MKSHPHSRTGNLKRDAFTLIELLVVISIIAILAGLAFPAVQGALGQGKKAKARNDVSQIAMAVKAYQLEYGKLPGAGGADAEIQNNILMAALAPTNTTAANTNNPRNIIFLEPKLAKGNKGGLGTDGKYYDPWGMPYTVILDYNYDNKIANTTASGINQTYFTTVIAVSGGPDTNMTSATDNIANVR